MEWCGRWLPKTPASSSSRWSIHAGFDFTNFIQLKSLITLYSNNSLIGRKFEFRFPASPTLWRHDLPCFRRYYFTCMNVLENMAWATLKFFGDISILLLHTSHKYKKIPRRSIALNIHKYIKQHFSRFTTRKTDVMLKDFNLNHISNIQIFLGHL